MCSAGHAGTRQEAKLTISRPFLLRRALPPQLRDLQPLESILFFWIPRHKVELCKLLLDVLHGGALARVVGGERRSFQTLAQDLVAQAGVCGIEGGGEKGALELYEGNRNVSVRGDQGWSCRGEGGLIGQSLRLVG